MTGPIISPWWFYLFSILSSVKDTLETIFIIFAIAFTIGIIIIPMVVIEEGIEVPISIKNKIKKAIITLCVLFGIYTLIPSEKTMYSMMIASVVTYENTEKTIEVIEDAADYIVEKFNDEN